MSRSPLRIAAAAGVLALTAWAFHAAVIRRAVTAVELRRGTVATGRVMARFTPDWVRPRAAHEALAIVEPIANGSPDDQRVAMLRGSNLLVLGQAEAAGGAFREALSWGQRPEIYVALANAQAARGDREAAIESLGKALAFDPYTLVGSDLPDLRAEAIRRFEATASPAHRAEMYLNMSIGYLSDGFENEAIQMAAIGALHDSRILTRRELLGDIAWRASRRRTRLRNEMR